MLSVLDLTRVQRLFCLGAHCDDIEIGAGGTILNLAKANPEIEVKWVVFGGETPRCRGLCNSPSSIHRGGDSSRAGRGSRCGGSMRSNRGASWRTNGV